MNYNYWKNYRFSSGTTTGNDYKQFQKEMKSDLKKQAKKEHFVVYKFLPNHYEFSAVLKKEDIEKYIYISISDVRFFINEWYNRVLIRTMEHDKDWTGGSNQYCKWTEVGKYANRLACQ